MFGCTASTRGSFNPINPPCRSGIVLNDIHAVCNRAIFAYKLGVWAKTKDYRENPPTLQWRQGRWGRTAPGDTLQGVTPEGKKLWANLQRIVEKRGRTGKIDAG